jgi:ferritin-like metal-binding protein YciE
MAKKTETLNGLFTDLLKDLYSAEKQLVKALPKMAKTTQSSELKKAFESHLKQTEKQVERIEHIFSELEGAPGGKKCVGMEGLVKEGDEIMKETEGDALDPGLIAAAQKVEHYEIASYGTAVAWAKTLGHNKAARILQETLDEEHRTNEKLTKIAETFANVEARSM